MIVFAAFAGLFAGLVHVLAGPDHLAAVAPLAVGRSERQWRAGLLWGVGHTTGVLLIGVLLLAFREAIPVDLISRHSERLVGVALIAMGVWGVWRARVQHTSPSHRHPTSQASFAMGTLHGLAGSSHLFGVLPALGLPTGAAAFVYLTGFGIGAVGAMTVFAALVGSFAVRVHRLGRAEHRLILYACSLSAFVVGAFWLTGS